jgi:hypothetical protein
MRYEIRAMSFGEILDTGWRLLRNHFALLVGIGAVLYLPLAILGKVFESSLEAATPDQVGQAALMGGVLFLIAVVLSPIVSAAVTHALGEVFLGRRASVGGSLRVATSILLPLMGTFLLYALAVMGGFLLLVIPGVYLMLCFMLVNQVVVIERVFGTRALRRSRELLSGNLGRAAGVMFVSLVIWTVLQTGVDLALSALPWVQPIASALVQAAGFAFYSAVGVLLYVDLRCRKEAFDLEHLSRLVSEAGRPAA